MEHKCNICGAVMVRHECPCCHGSGDDPDLAVGDDGRYYQPACWVCDGTGRVPHCPDEENDAHQTYDREEAQKLAQAEAGQHFSEAGQWDWWMLSAPLEVAVMQRMELQYPTAEELAANGYQWSRPLPDMQIVREELARLEALTKEIGQHD